MKTNKRIKKLKEQANRLRNNGQTQESIEKYKELIEAYRSENNLKEMGHAYQMIGVCHKIENNLEKAISAYQKALDLFEEIGHQDGIGNTYRDLGITYAYDHQYQKSIPWLEKSAEALSDSEDRAALGITLAKTGLSYLRLEDPEKAEELMREGLSHIRQDGHWFLEMTTLLNLAEVYFSTRQYEPMITHLWGALGIVYEESETENQKRRLAQIYGLLAQGYLYTGSVCLAVNFYYQSVELLKDMPPETKEVVFEDIRASEFINQLTKEHPKEAEKMTKDLNLPSLNII